ncbi:MULTISPECIES: hypothetical protein [Klebsiella pneumoniae complex]|nr:hypothetical protein [Klebsiella pneumoniae]MBC5126928.1 hypothetical protein [Klebsiella quasipneumoniae]MBC5132990.1 hypothetical protein [Klebsiella quasipneumoniae]MBC5205942.1 hypothetical protein [Klebsiella quasipneumoniae]
MTVFITMGWPILIKTLTLPGNEMNITESAQWEKDIYLIARQDKVEGGRSGVVNIQAQQLANRTLWLMNNLNELKEVTYSEIKVFSSDTAGFAATVKGEVFRVAQGMDADLSFIFYENTGSEAMALTAWPGIGYIKKISGLIEENDGDALVSLVDGDGFVFAEIKKVNDAIALQGIESVEMGGSALQRNESALLSLEDTDGFTALSVAEDRDGDIAAEVAAVSLGGAKMKQSPDAILSFEDRDGFTAFDVTEDDGDITVRADALGLGDVKIRAEDDATLRFGDRDGFELDFEDLIPDQTSAVASLVSEMNTVAAAESSLAYIPYDRLTAVVRKGLNIVLVYGQSFAPAAQGYTAITTQVSPRGNLMLGLSPRGKYFVRSADAVFGVVGDEAVYHPLREVRQKDDGTLVSDDYASETQFGETILSGLLETLKHLHNREAGVQNDTGVVFAGSCTGAAGTTIAQLSKGSAEGWFGRFTDCIDQHLIAAEQAGFESVQVVAIVYAQGQNDAGNSGMTHDAYQTSLLNMQKNTVAEVMARTGQDAEPLFCITQTGGVYIGNGQANTLPVACAQLDVAQSVKGAFFAGVEFVYPNPGAHMYANSYRWNGCAIAKAIYPAVSGRRGSAFRILDAVYDGEKILVSLDTPQPPLKTSPFYVRTTETLFSDAGFTVIHDDGALYGADLTVSFISPYVVQIVPSKSLTGTIRLNLGDYLHNGGHNITDSDEQQSIFKWEYNGINGQKSAENIPALINKRYSLRNRPASYSLKVRTI